MKHIIFQFFFICFFTIASCKAASIKKTTSRDDLKAKLQGVWNCTSIKSKSDKVFQLPFSPTDGYLRFVFKASRIFIAHSPVDQGKLFSVKFEENSFLLKQEYKGEIKFSIDKITENELWLLYTDDNGEIITIAFIRPEDSGTIEIKNQKSTHSLSVAIVVYNDPEVAILNRYANQFTINNVKSYSLLSRQTENYVDGIQFNTRKAESFDTYLAKAIDVESLLKIDSANNRLVVDFEILTKHILNIKFINPISYQFSNQIFDILSASKEYWRLSGDVKTPVKIRMKLIVLKEKDRTATIHLPTID